MGRLVLQMRVSRDGLVARPGRHGSVGWGLPTGDPALKERKLEWLRDAGRHLMGRNTYEEMAEFWPGSDDAYAAPMNEIPKVVFSGTLERAEWADSRIARDLADEIAELKREPGKDMIAWGGATFAQSLTALGLVDEFRLVLQPVALGAGLPCSRTSRRRCGSSSSTRRHTTRARRCTSTAPRLRPPDQLLTMFKW